MTHTVQRAVVLAAGRGTRMMPLTAERPKPLIPVAGVPMLERVLRGVQGAGVREVLVIHGYRGQMILDAFGDGAPLGLRLQYAAQPVPNGTAGALRLAEGFCGEAPFVLHWGDILLDPANYAPLLAAYAAARPAALLGVNWLDDPCAGAAVYHEDGRVTAIVEKPAPGTSTTHWNAAGVNVLDPRVWPYLHRVTSSPRGEYEFTDVIRLLLAAGEAVACHEFSGLWSDVGTPAVVAALNTDARLASI